MDAVKIYHSTFSTVSSDASSDSGCEVVVNTKAPRTLADAAVFYSVYCQFFISKTLQILLHSYIPSIEGEGWHLSVSDVSTQLSIVGSESIQAIPTQVR